MGRLIQLELENFKSYQGHQIIGPFRDFTCVIGPNGSGKSNLMDAISFVLGVKSSQLRSSHLKELLYRSNAMPFSADADMESVASVDDDADDRSSVNGAGNATAAYVQAVYEKSDGTRVHFRRSVNEQGASEYSIDGRVLPYGKYNQVLEQENILVKARNFLVFQGDVEAIASQSSRDLTKLIEQISGSGDLKAEYERLKDEQERAADNSTFNFNKKRGINAEIKQFKEQKKEADHFAEMLEQRANLIITHMLWRLYHIEQDLDKLSRSVQQKMASVDGQIKKQEETDEQLRELRKQQAQIHKDCMKLEKSMAKVNKDLDARRPELLKISEELGHIEKKLKLHQQSLEKVQKEFDSQSEVVRDLTKQKKTLEKAEKRFEATLKETLSKSSIQLTDAQRDNYSQIRAAVDAKIINEKRELEELSRAWRTKNEEVAQKTAKHEQYTQQRNRLSEDCRIYEERKAKLSDDISRVHQEVKSVKTRLTENATERKRIDKLEKEHEERLADCYQQLTQARYDKRENERTARLRDAIETMRRIFPGVHGRIVDLCKPLQKKYTVAVSVILGKNIDAIVVDESKTAIDCIQYLKDQEIGLATFLPLDSIQAKHVNEKYRSFAKGTRLAIDCVQFDPSLDRAFEYAFGNSLICDTLDVARNVCYDRGQKVKAVTLDGTVIHKAGLITGGQSEKLAANSQIWEAKEIENLHKLKDRLEVELHELHQARRKLQSDEALTTELQGLEKRLAMLNEDMSATVRKLESIETEIQFIGKEEGVYMAERKMSESSADHLEEQLNRVRAKIHQVEDVAFGPFCQQLNIPDIREYENDQLQAQQEASEKRLQFSTQKSRLENEIAFAKDQLAKLQQRLDTLQESIATENKKREELIAKKQTLMEANEQLNAELHRLKEVHAAERKNEDAKISECNEMKRLLMEHNRTLDHLKRDISGKENLIEKLHYERNDLFQKCKLEEIEIPLVNGSLDEIPMAESKDSAADSDSMDIDSQSSSSVTKSQEYQAVVVDFSELDDDLKASPSETIETKFQERIRNMTNEIEHMAPNMKAIDRLDGVENRLKETVDEFEKARRQAKKLKDEFLAVKQRRYELFHKAFSHIAERIDQIYKELTRTQTHPLGGTAYLTLENSDEPYLEGVKFHAMPPMKRFRDMEQLSGGEKTVAALALLFAIHSYHPSPFFVLDEVDAALDNANVAKVAQYIRQHSGTNFQFVVISLKNSLYEKSEALVGIYRDRESKGSRVLTLDLTQYVEE